MRRSDVESDKKNARRKVGQTNGAEGGSPRVSIGLPVFNGEAYLADAIASILLHPENSERMGRAGREWVAAHFSRRSFAERLTEIVEELAASGDRRSS